MSADLLFEVGTLMALVGMVLTGIGTNRRLKRLEAMAHPAVDLRPAIREELARIRAERAGSTKESP